MAKDEKDRQGVGELISFLRWLAGLTQTALSKLSGIDRSRITRYEQGIDMPQPGSFRRIIVAAGIPPHLVEFLRWCLRLIRKSLAAGQVAGLPPDEPGTQEATRSAVWSFVDRALALARVELALLRNARQRIRPSPPTDQDHRRVEQLWQRLKGCSEAKQRLLIDGARSYQDWLLAVRISRESETAAANKPAEALKLAELAVFVARRINPDAESPAAWLARLEGWCTAFLGNAQKAANDVPLAAATFARALHLWHQGEDEAGLLSEAYLLDLEASLRRAQGLFPLALELHDKARKTARPEELGVILVNKAVTFQEKGDPEKALPILEEAAQVIDGERQPRLRFGLRFNQAASLCLLGRAEEAASIVDEVRRLAEGLRNDVDLVKTVWLRGNLDAGLGKRKEALEALEQVWRDFEVRQLPYDYALASLDAALLYREEGRFPEIKALAQEILQIFRAQGVHREAIGAVILFQEAVEKEQVTPALVRRLQDYLSKARSDPKLRFKA
jgi:tetratricopeptide (TPR) repeat protein